MNSEKSTKYDRQLRLWANDGQRRLELAHVCLINATPVGAETLKNLVLPGVGAFTIVDDRTVKLADLAGNLFLQRKDVGANIAEAMCEGLLELNQDVKGTPVAKSLQETLREPTFLWDDFTAVVASEHVPATALSQLADTLWEKNIPLLVVRTSGFYGSVHIIVNETTIVETHDPLKLYDLRIDCPWPELQQYADSFDMDALDDADHAHVPYIVIFIKALRLWRLDHDGKMPQNYSEKKLFRSAYVEAMARNYNIETNFVEASQAVHRALQVTGVPASVAALFKREEIVNVGLKTPLFWLYVLALKCFVEKNEGKLPLPGNLPDMASTTSNYVALQKLYRDRAIRDQERFSEELLTVFREIGRSEEELSQESIATFCKNAAFLYVSNGSKKSTSDALVRELSSTDSDHNTLAIHFGLLALQSWLDEGSGSWESLLNYFVALAPVETIPKRINNTLCEIFRHHTTHYANTASLIGGITGQEMLKIVTAQYIPLDNLYVYDGVRSVSNKWKVR